MGMPQADLLERMVIGCSAIGCSSPTARSPIT